MWALLKLIPLKDYLYGILLVTLLALFGWYTVHERSIGHQAAVAAEQQATAKELEHVTRVQTTAQGEINGIEQAYNAALASTPADSPHLIVHYSSPGTGDLCAVTVSASKLAGSSDLSKAGETVDVGPPLDRLLFDADAEVTALQAIIASDREEINAR